MVSSWNGVSCSKNRQWVVYLGVRGKNCRIGFSFTPFSLRLNSGLFSSLSWFGNNIWMVSIWISISKVSICIRMVESRVRCIGNNWCGFHNFLDNRLDNRDSVGERMVVRIVGVSLRFSLSLTLLSGLSFNSRGIFLSRSSNRYGKWESMSPKCIWVNSSMREMGSICDNWGLYLSGLYFNRLDNRCMGNRMVSKGMVSKG